MTPLADWSYVAVVEMVHNQCHIEGSSLLKAVVSFRPEFRVGYLFRRQS